MTNGSVIYSQIASDNMTTRILLNDLRKNIKKVKSVSTIYQKINSEIRHKITIVIEEETHYEDV